MYENIKDIIAAKFYKGEPSAAFKVAATSYRNMNGCKAFIMRYADEDLLVASSGFGFKGEPVTVKDEKWLICRKTHENAEVLRRIFPYTAPLRVLREGSTIGLGDRLGIASEGHIEAIRDTGIIPILAQQSMRELTLTGRSFEEVLDSASWGVFTSGYEGGFGADGDHLKTEDEVRLALRCGYTVITLDCSEHIHCEASSLTDDEVMGMCPCSREEEERYCAESHDIGGMYLSFSLPDLCRGKLIYSEAIEYAVKVYKEIILPCGRADLELSVDETAFPTSPIHHYYIASELRRRGAVTATVAPRFCGEFQKGIDYIGDLRGFEEQIALHSAIACHFGHKLSIHSGSDKFSVFRLIQKYTRGRVHLKTAGTSWLEAMKIIAEKDPSLFREIHYYSLNSAMDRAKAFYRVGTTAEDIPRIEDLSDEALPEIMKNESERQMIHISYGYILNDTRFRMRLYDIWRTYSEEYTEALSRHIGKHLTAFISSPPAHE